MWNLSNLKNLVKINNTAFTYAGNNLLNPIEVKADGLTNLTVIEIGAFSYCNKISKINLSGCTKLNFVGSAQTFAYMNNLESVDFTDCPALNFLCNGILRANPVFTSIIGWEDLKNQITKIDQYAFNNTPQFNDDINGMQNLISIGAYAFEFSDAPWVINDWPKIETIANNAFQKCTALGEFNFTGSTTLKSIGGGCFGGVNQKAGGYETYGPTKLILKDCTALTSLGGSALSFTKTKEVILDGCTSLVTAPSFLFESMSLEKLSLRDCTALTEPGTNFCRHNYAGTTAGHPANPNLKEIDLTGCVNLTKISTLAFCGNKALVRAGWLDDLNPDEECIYFPHSRYPLLESLGDSAFVTNSSKIVIDGLIGESIFTGKNVFSGWSNNKEVFISMKDCPNATAFGNTGALHNSYYAINSNKTHVIRIDASNWPNCKTIKPQSVFCLAQLGTTADMMDLDECFPNLETIEDNAFPMARYSTLKCTSGHLKSIGKGAFRCGRYGVSLLKHVNIVSSPDLILGACAFFANNQLEDVNISGCTNSLELGDRCFGYTKCTYQSGPTSSWSGTTKINLNSALPTISSTWTYNSNIPDTLYRSVFAGLSKDGLPVEIHFPAAIEAEMKEYAKTLEDGLAGDTNLSYWITSNGTLSTTTGGAAGNVTADVNRYYQDPDSKIPHWNVNSGQNPIELGVENYTQTTPGSVIVSVIFDL